MNYSHFCYSYGNSSSFYSRHSFSHCSENLYLCQKVCSVIFNIISVRKCECPIGKFFQYVQLPFRGFLAVRIASHRLGIWESRNKFSIPPVRIRCLNFSAFDTCTSFRRKSDCSCLVCLSQDGCFELFSPCQ